MSDVVEVLKTETDIKRAEYLLKKAELEQKEKNSAKAWQKVIAAPLVIAIIAAFLSGFAALYVENSKISSSGENGKFSREHALLLEADQLTRDDRRDRLCQYAFSNSFQHQDSRDILDRFIAENPTCKADGIETTPDPIQTADVQLEQCISARAMQTASCRAYDKSGFHSVPRASCTISLNAGDGRFFPDTEVTVVDEFYRRLSGPPVAQAVVPSGGSDPVRSFSGDIRCSNSAGTGRTCEARATVQAPSYPDECLPRLSDLAEL